MPQEHRADAQATSAYFIVETMGRKAGWLAYGVSTAGEANLCVSVEDVDESLQNADGKLDIDKLATRIVDVIISREGRGMHFGTVVIAEGLSELLPDDALRGVQRDDHGQISFASIDLSELVVDRVKRQFEARTGRKKAVKGKQLGYESRCAPPHAFDVMLGSQLGIGAYRALVEEGLDAHMVSVSGQLDLHYVPFHKLVDPDTMVTQVRYVRPGSDFHRLARFLETRTETTKSWSTGPRKER